MKTKSLMLAVLAIALASCSNKQSEVMPATGNATLSLTGKSEGMLITKASSIDLPANTTVGVYATQTNAPATTLVTTQFKNAPYIATGSAGAFTSLAPFTLISSNTYNVCAYAPQLGTTPVDPTAVSFNHGDDILFAANVPVTFSGTTVKTATAALSFVHKMSQIKFTLVSGAGSPAPVIAGASLMVTGFNESCTMNLNTGVVTPVLGAGASVTQAGTAVCFVPNSTAMMLSVTITTTDGRVYYGTINTVFNASSSYSYTLTLNKNDAQLGFTGTVVDWIPVDGGNVSLAG